MSDFTLKLLPPEADIETKMILKQLARSLRALAELKGFVQIRCQIRIYCGL